MGIVPDYGKSAADRAFAEAQRRIEEAGETGAKTLDLSKLGITVLPDSLGNLSNLTRLNLFDNRLTDLPDSLANLSNLARLNLSHNRFIVPPDSLRGLTSLRVLRFSSNHLTALHNWIGNLTKLVELRLSKNYLTVLPDSLGNLSNLTHLHIVDNRLAVLPDCLSNLSNLTRLELSRNLLSILPDWLGNLTDLTLVYIFSNNLTVLPDSLGNLARLARLDLSYNQLQSLPNSLGNLANLTYLDVSGNRLESVPDSLGNLPNLTEMRLANNPLGDPPPEIVQRGTKAVLGFLHERQKKGRRQWVSKLILVGEGGVGKSELLRSLKGEEFAANLETTHGIEVRQLELSHPTEQNVRMMLNCWDFGGQEIYHATHQFFLTQRSLFVLVWNARLGWEPCKLYYWLDAIKARAPDAAVLIVATWTDERSPDLPLADIMRAYPQVKAHHAVSNKERTGIEELRLALAGVAAKLPLMGEVWPDTWLSAAESIRASKERHVAPQEFCAMLSHSGVARENHSLLGAMLHDLGDVLWFQDDRELNDLVILKPQWVTEYISKVLESSDVIGREGIYTRPHMDQLWQDLKPEMRDHFLRLMERFDLSYRTLDPENREVSLVVERLPLDPAQYEDEWNKPLAQQCCRTLTMRYRMNTVPAGIPTWFIARSHRFTTHTHWRNGALFADGKEKRHLALVRCYQHERVVELSARGPMPHNFFALLRDGFELTLARFPGLDVTRTMPCPGHDDKECKHEFKYADLENRLLRVPARESIECPVAVQDVSVSELMFGLSWRTTENAVLKKMEAFEQKLDQYGEAGMLKLAELHALRQREFLTLFESLQKDPDVQCPSVFFLRPLRKQDVGTRLLGQKVEVQFLCQAPGKWHVPGELGRYVLKDLPAWARAVASLLRPVLKALQPTTRGIEDLAAIGAPGLTLKDRLAIGFTAAVLGQLPTLEEGPMQMMLDSARDESERSFSDRSAMRAVREFLDQVDPDRKQLGLKLIPTPEGHAFWLCEHHAKEFAPGPVKPKTDANV